MIRNEETAMADLQRFEADINTGKCPVCARSCGRRAVRAAVMAHLRAATEPRHVEWRDKHWAQLFRRGPRPIEPSVDDRLRAMVESVGREAVLAKLQTTCC